MALLAIRHFVSPTLRGGTILVGKINEVTKELALHLAPLGHELVGIHVWSEVNVIADALSSVKKPPELRQSRREFLKAFEWTCLKCLKEV